MRATRQYLIAYKVYWYHVLISRYRLKILRPRRGVNDSLSKPTDFETLFAPQTRGYFLAFSFMNLVKCRLVSIHTMTTEVVWYEWLDENGQWRYTMYPHHIWTPDFGHISGLYRRDRFTGRIDKNGTEIYENDTISSPDYHDKKWIITWVNDSEYCWFVPREVWKESLSFFVSWGNMVVENTLAEWLDVKWSVEFELPWIHIQPDERIPEWTLAVVSHDWERVLGVVKNLHVRTLEEVEKQNNK